MADPTQPARDLIKKGLSYLVPENSPLANSGANAGTPALIEKLKQEDVPAQPQEQVAAAPDEEVSFVNPAAQDPAVERTPSMFQGISSDGLDTYESGLKKEASAIDKLGKQEAGAFDQAQAASTQYVDQVKAIQEKEDKAFMDFEKEDAETKRKMDNFELKPADIFAGKTTWQKILGGVGMFLGSITPEGAKNVQSMINAEIERDIDRQKQTYALMKDKRNETANMYKKKLDKYGSEKLAVLSLKQDALSAVEFQIKKLQASAKGELARGKLEQGLGTIKMEQDKINSARAVEYAKLNKEANKGMLPGYQGTNQNPTIVKDLTDRIAAKNAAFKAIDELISLSKKGAVTPFTTDNKTAKQTRTKLSADMAKAMFGRSSDSELKVAESLIPDITSLTQGKGVDVNLLNSLKQKLANDVEAAASAAGYSRSMPQGARKIN